MTDTEQIACATREAILKLLSDSEIARVSIVEMDTHLAAGDEYVDLEELDGVRQVHGKSTPPGRFIPRKAVYASTWFLILAQLSASSVLRARSNA